LLWGASQPGLRDEFEFRSQRAVGFTYFFWAVNQFGESMTWMFVKRARLAAAGFFVLAGLPPAHAVNVQPLSLEMVSIGSNSRGGE
jgi:hypothetical protein